MCYWNYIEKTSDEHFEFGTSMGNRWGHCCNYRHSLLSSYFVHLEQDNQIQIMVCRRIVSKFALQNSRHFIFERPDALHLIWNRLSILMPCSESTI